MEKGTLRLLWLAIGLAAALLLPTPSLAQMYVGVYGGITLPDGSLSESAYNARFQEMVGETGVKIDVPHPYTFDVDYDASPMVGGRVGYWFKSAPWIGLEAEAYWANPKIRDQQLDWLRFSLPEPDFDYGTLRFPIEEADVDVLTVGFNMVFRFPHGPVQPYFGLGVGVVHAKVDDVKTLGPGRLTLDESGAELATVGRRGDTLIKGGDATGAGPQALVGARVFVTNNVALFAESKLTLNGFKLHDIELDYDALHFLGGIEFHFGPGGVPNRRPKRLLRNPRRM